MRRQLLPPARRRIKVIVNDRITAYIQSLDAGNGPLLDSIEEEALADCVPIIRRETSAFLKTLIALKRPRLSMVWLPKRRISRHFSRNSRPVLHSSIPESSFL